LADDRQHSKRAGSAVLAAQQGGVAENGAELRPDDPADNSSSASNRIDGAVGVGLQEGDVGARRR
jgi:hypothetical protein